MRLKTVVLISVTLFILDRLLKYTALNWSGFFISAPFFGVGFGLVKNAGVGLSLAVPNYITIPLAVMILSILIWLIGSAMRSQPSIDFYLFALVLIFSGGMSNLIDRIFHHFVVDYISLYTLERGFSFNVGDMMIFSGVVAGILLWVKKQRKMYESKNSRKNC